ncbi:unnamed protein product [Camellia sinensis]
MRRNLSRHCAYHNENRHMTQGCKALKTHLEDLVRQGYLRDFVDEARTREEQARLPQATVAPPLPAQQPQAGGPQVISVIHSKVSENEIREETQKVKHLQHVYQVGEKRHRAEECQGPVVSFSEADLEMVQHPHNDALVVFLQVGECQVRCILIDQGSSCDIMYVRCYKELSLHPYDMEQSNSPMVGFNGTPTWPLGTTILEVQAGTRKITTEFIIIDTPSPYNIILGRPWLHAMRVVPSTLHQLLQFPTEHGIEEISCRQKTAP